tara:strand:- start:23573 stop:25303 length:1731 start_codon:yes stop_codon:yes gene_type:complete
MVDYVGVSQTAAQKYLISDAVDNGSGALTYGHGLNPQVLADTPGVLNLDFMHNLVAGPGKTNFVLNAEHVALWYDQGIGLDFFEDYHVIPRSFDFGNILSAQSSPVDVFSGYRQTVGSWTSFVNNAGSGTTLSGAPSLPATMFPLESYAMTLEISTSGNPSVDTTLDFVFDGSITVAVPIVLNRIVLFPVRPEIPYTELMQFKTDLLSKESGKEQRIKLRKNPRQFFNWRIRTDDGTFDRSRLDTLMFDWQSRTWGVPIWHEATELSVAATAGDLTINVGSTDDADYRVGDLVLIFTDATTFDVQTLASLTSTTITFSNVILNSYTLGASVAPLRTANLKKSVGANRFISGDQELNLNFRVLDNDSELADVTGWDTYNSKILLDTCNVIRGSSLGENYLRDMIVADNGTGVTAQDSPWDNGKRSTTLTLRANSRAEVWNLRQLMHHFAGRQVSFYVPTFTQDLVATQPLTTASQDLVIDNIGYTQFIRLRQPRNHIWLRHTDGTVITREITGAIETSSTIETLELNATWGDDISLAQIDRISYLEEVRINTDDIRIEYARGERQVYFTAPIISVFD